MSETASLPTIDLHCDLLSYLTLPNSSIQDASEIGCALPHLQEGNIKLQTMAMYAPTQKNSHEFGIQQSQIFKALDEEENAFYAITKDELEFAVEDNSVGMIAAIENASAFCDEEISLEEGFLHLDEILQNVGDLFYIGLTHHHENRFGGGNQTTIGLKDDGKALLDFLDNKNIAVDISHTSDALAQDILGYISKQNIAVPVLASHSNFRAVCDHPRNLPDEIAQEIIQREGLIGINFLRAYVDDKEPSILMEHIAHGIRLGAEDTLCFGADYFYHKSHPDTSRIPFFFEQHQDARCYNELEQEIENHFGERFCEKINHHNAIRFLEKNS